VPQSDNIFDSVAEYWTRHNVTLHKRFSSRQESVEYFHWRCDQYPGYIDLMPVKGLDGIDILDYGCGPGDDIVGFLEYSKPRRLVGADVSSASLGEAQARAQLHGGAAEFVQLNPTSTRLPFPDQSFDYIHSCGVVHHVPDLVAILKEFRRILRPWGRSRIMVYNYDSIWMHLYVAYRLRYKEAAIPANLPIRQAFTRSTDGPECPIANCYRPDEFIEQAGLAGFQTKFLGAACSLFEMQNVQALRLEACTDQRLEREHREFLVSLTFNEYGRPVFSGEVAGIDGVFDLIPR